MPKTPTYFKERKEFLSRMLRAVDKIPYAREQKFAKDIFADYPPEFLLVVREPFELKSLAWFLSSDGKAYLTKEYKIWQYKPKTQTLIEGTEKVGYNYEKKKPKTFRDFLNE